MLISALFLTHLTWNNVFDDLANQKTEFLGLQSILQSRKNYRSDNKRLEMEISMKNLNTKAFQS